jgi:hypothetical protein
VLLQESVEGQAFLAEPQNEAAQSGQAAQHLMYPFQVSNWTHLVEGRDFLRAGLDAPLGDDVSLQHAARHPKDALFGVQFHPIGPWAIKRNAQIVNQAIRLPSFDDDVIYVCLHGPPDVVPENVLHTSLVQSTSIPKTKWHRYVAKHAEWRDERGRELIELLHLYLVVTRIVIKETQKLASRSGIHNLIDSWQWKRNFGTCFIQTSVIFTHLPLLVLLLN